MLDDMSADVLASEVTRLVYERARELSAALGSTLGKPQAPKVASEVRTIVRYVQGLARELPNEEIIGAIDSVIGLLSGTCYPPATSAARAVFERKAGEPQTELELALLAARARWNIEQGLDVPIRWLAALCGISLKTARNLASAGQLFTQTQHGRQVCSAREATRWLSSRGIGVKAGARLKRLRQP